MEMFLVGIGKMKGIPRLRLLGIFFFFFWDELIPFITKQNKRIHSSRAGSL
jgi:hypothetical protein